MEQPQFGGVLIHKIVVFPPSVSDQLHVARPSPSKMHHIRRAKVGANDDRCKMQC